MSVANSMLENLNETGTAICRALRVSSLPKTLVVLGSGFKGFEQTLVNAKSINLSSFPHIAAPTVAGHGSSLVVGDSNDGHQVAVMTGRLHMYEGLSAHDIVYPIRAMARIGVKRILLTNASGSLRAAIPPGKIVAVRDQINLTGTSCLLGESGRLLGPQFVDMGAAFDATWTERICAFSPDIVNGVYAGVLGPAYETPAEARMLALLGADVVGMSTVQEVIAARQLALEVACLSFVTNMSGGLGITLKHEDVLQLAADHQQKLQALLNHAIGA